MMVRLFGVSDQIHLTNYSDNNKEWPVYSNLGNIDLTIRSKPSNLGRIFVALLPVPLKYDIEVDGKTLAVKDKRIHDQEDVRYVFELIFHPLDVLINNGKLMLSADGQLQQCLTAMSEWMAAYIDDSRLYSIKQQHSLVCEALKLSLGEGNSLSRQLRQYQLYFQKMILASQGEVMDRQEARQYLED